MNQLGWTQNQRIHFLILVVIFLSHQFLEKKGIHFTFIDSYLDPLLCMPFFLSLILWQNKVLIYKNIHYVLPKILLIASTILISIIAEIIFPLLQPQFISDYWDILCYIIGTVYFQLFFNH